MHRLARSMPICWSRPAECSRPGVNPVKAAGQVRGGGIEEIHRSHNRGIGRKRVPIREVAAALDYVVLAGGTGKSKLTVSGWPRQRVTHIDRGSHGNGNRVGNLAGKVAYDHGVRASLPKLHIIQGKIWASRVGDDRAVPAPDVGQIRSWADGYDKESPADAEVNALIGRNGGDQRD